MFDVAIVGLGPTGAVAAGLLAQAGLRVWAADKLAGVYEIPRAIALDHEVLRVFQQIGVLDAVLPSCEPFTPSEYFGVDGQLIRRMTMVAPPYPQGHVPSMVFSQPPLERALRAHLAAQPKLQLALGCEVQQLAQDADGVSLSTSAGPVRARWLIACDGGSSPIRGQLGLPLDDLGFDEPWLVVDVHVNPAGLAKLPTTSVQYCEPDRPCTLVIGPKNHRRWEISLKPGEDPAEAATPERTWALLARWLSPADGQLWRQSSYRFHALVARQWRQGRVFLAGDAAHMQPPFLGQGMCQGIRDAANLAWKLAAVQRGEVGGAAADALLDSYGLERGAHVRELTTRLKGVGAVICERDPAKARARDARLLAECGGIVRDTPRQDVLPALTCGMLSASATSARGSLLPQPRLADAEAAAGAVLMDQRFGHGWRLLLAPAMLPPELDHESPCSPTVIALGSANALERDGVLSAWMARHACRAALVRPDHCVYGTAHDAASLAMLLAEQRNALNHPTGEPHATT